VGADLAGNVFVRVRVLIHVRNLLRFGAAMIVVSLLTVAAPVTRLPVAPASPVQDPSEGPGWFAYASNADGDYEIFAQTLNGSRVQQLTDNDVDDTSPSFSPNGRRLVFERATKDGSDDLYILNRRRDWEKPWVVSKHVDEGAPEWSPDGRWIAFKGGDAGDGSSVVAMTVNKKKVRGIALQEENSENDYPSWSPDSSEVAFVESYDTGDIFIASRCCEGSKRRQVTTDADIESNLDWSPDGDCIVYSLYRNQLTGEDMYSVSVEGGPPRRLTDAMGDEIAGAWSPDSAWIAFASNEDGNYDLYMMKADGSETQAMIAGTAADEITPDWWVEPEFVKPTRPNCDAEGGPVPSITPAP
jgi:TolB protein